MSDTSPTVQSLPPGLLGGAIFFGTVISGCVYIVFSKAWNLSPVFVTSVPVLIMITYAGLMAAARFLRLRDDQAGDNLYYMGFLFTLTSLAVSLYQFTGEGSAEAIVQNFGIAIASTIAGIALRIFFHQMRRDPVEVESTARLELADASRRVKRELEGTVLEFAYFRRMTLQAMTDGIDEMKEMLAEMRQTMASELKEMANDISRPLEETSKRSGDTVDALAERISAVLDEVAERLVRETDHFSRGASASIGAIQTMVGQLKAMQTPEQIIEIKLAPMIQGLSRAVNSFKTSTEIHEKTVDKSLKRTQDLANVIANFAEQLRANASSQPRQTEGTWGPLAGGKAAE